MTNAMNNSTFFHRDNVEILARFLVELTRLGATYYIAEQMDGWLVTVTGA